nr:hypothetical protein [Tanacetum cinerariifolium]
MKKSEVTEFMRAFVKGQWCAAHNGTITMQKVRAMHKQQLIEEYEYICKRLENDRLLSAQHSLFRPKPAIPEPSAKRQRVEEPSSQPATVSATSVSATVVSAAPDTSSLGASTFSVESQAKLVFAAPRFTDSTVITTASMDSAVTRCKVGVSPFADPAADASPFLSSIAADQIPVGVLFESTSMNLQEFFLDSDEEIPPGMSRVAAEPDSDDEVVTEILFRGQSICGDRVVFVDTLPDDEIADPRVKVETVSESTSSPPLTRRKHLGERDLWRDVNMLRRSLHANDVEEFWRDQDDWIVSSWTLYTKSTVYVLDLTNGKTVYMFMGSSYPIRATLLERMLRHRLTVPPSYCRHVRVGGIVVGTMAGTIIRTVQADLLQATMPVSSAPIACTAQQMVFSSPWLTAKKESGSPLQTALVCNSNPLMVARLPKAGCSPYYSMYEELASPEQTATDFLKSVDGCQVTQNWMVFTFRVPFWNEKWLVQEGTALGKDFLKSVDG